MIDLPTVYIQLELEIDMGFLLDWLRNKRQMDMLKGLGSLYTF